MRFIIAILLSTLASTATAANIYEVKNVTVIETTPDLNKAHDQALLDAQTKAFNELQQRLITNNYIPKFQKINEARISTAVDSIDVITENGDSKSYKGTYNITFSPYQISKIFNIKSIAASKEPEKFLVIPIIEEDGQIRLWKNNWWPTWNALNKGAVVVPLGDLEDIQNLKPEDLTSHHLTNLPKILQRYGANVTVLIQAEYDEAAQSLNVQLEKISGKEKTVINYEYPGGKGITQDDLFQAAAEDISFRLQNNKLSDENLITTLNDINAKPSPKPAEPEVEPYSPNAPGAGFLGDKKPYVAPPVVDKPVTQKPAIIEKPAPAKQLVKPASAKTQPTTQGINNSSDAIVQITDLAAWQRIKTKISGVPGTTLKTKSMGDGKAYISLQYKTDIETFKKALSAKGLMVISSGTNLAIKEK